jgi:type IV secretory pathway TraG/TraD family ATPase VirD4
MNQSQVTRSIAATLVICGAVIAGAFFFAPELGYLALLLLVIPVFQFLRELKGGFTRDRQARGRDLLDEWEAKRLCDAKRGRDPQDPGILWGKLRLQRKDAYSHFCVVGAVGSGKTITIRLLMQDQLSLITPRSNRRAIVYDAKQEMVQILGSIKLSCPVYVLNPFDVRATAWDMAKDIDSPAAARQLAATLVSDEKKESQPFFSNAVRELLVAIVTVFLITRPGRWTFREVLLVIKSKTLLKAVLGTHEFTKGTIHTFLECGEVTLGSIMATVATKLGPYEAIAAAWEHAKQKISVKEWLASESILVLGNDERVRTSLDTVNQLFIAITAQHVLAMSEDSNRMNWFFFDEFREAGKLPGLESIILRGRSKGCCVVLGFQDIQGVQHVYDEKLGNELVGQCGNKAFLRIESPQTAEWASKSIGDKEAYEYDESWSTSSQGNSRSVTARKQTRPQVMASEFMQLPVTNLETTGLHGIYIVRSVGAFRAEYPAPALKRMLGELNPRVPPFRGAPIEWQYLRPWDLEDCKRLGIEMPRERADKQTDGRLGDFERMEL